MPKGGARINSGPPPDPNALRRDRSSDRDGWTTLPSSGYDGPVPTWPLSDATDECRMDREIQVWEQIWRSPQAAAWARLGWTHDVALYVRFLTISETGDLKAATEVRQWSDRLGLNPAAMLRNRWRVAEDQVGEKRTEKTTARTKTSSARSRLKAINGGEG